MTTLWRLSAHVDFGILGDLANRLALLETTQAFDWSLYDEGDIARLDILFESEPDTADFRRAAELPEDQVIDLTRFAETDRHLLQEPGLKPCKIGRFVLGDAGAMQVAAHEIAIDVRAGDSFGSGRHPSTRGCLERLDRMSVDGFKPARILDMGCGSAILAIAASKLYPDAALTAVDADAGAIVDARANCQRNQAEHIHLLQSEGYAHDQLREARFDLVVVNVYGPLHIELTPYTRRAIAPGGRAMLSGLQLDAEDATRAAIKQAGLRITDRVRIENWLTLTVEIAEQGEKDQ